MNKPVPTVRPRRPGLLGAVSALLLALIVAFGVGEWLGWPFLAAPMQRWLSTTLDRRVSFDVPAEAAASATSSATTETPAGAVPFRARFLGGLRLELAQLEIAAPAWSSAPHLLLASDVALELRYTDLWRARGGEPLRIERLAARKLDSQLERLADGRVSWQFRPKALDADAASPEHLPPPLLGHLRLSTGVVRYHDAPLALDIEARLSLQEPVADAGARLHVQASGRFRDFPLRAELTAYGALPWMADAAAGDPVPLVAQATVGRASLDFKGTARSLQQLDGLAGRYRLAGPSLAAVGDPVGITLPTTAPFRAEGRLVKQGTIWRVVIDAATVGASRLNGAFSYSRGPGRPLLAGRLGGQRLALVDLGPVVGTTAPAVSSPPPKAGKVLPVRPFDLAALRKMDADVLIDIAEVDLHTTLLEPLHPLRTHLTLNQGVLTLADIDARTAQGQLMGLLSLDGRGNDALWRAELRWDRLQLERWIHQTRADGSKGGGTSDSTSDSPSATPPWISGRLAGMASLQGHGRSTAEILASLKGRTHTELSAGAISHLAVEAAGLDIAQALGVAIKGDDALPVQCGVADLLAEGGVFRPRIMVVDTTDSTLWIDGTLSLATETLDLRAVVAPKDFSPLTLRTPLRVTGSLAHPQVSVDKAPLARKVASSLLLGLINPLAALIPLIDPGDPEAAKRSAAGCQALMQRVAAKTS